MERKHKNEETKALADEGNANWLMWIKGETKKRKRVLQDIFDIITIHLYNQPHTHTHTLNFHPNLLIMLRESEATSRTRR